MTTIPPTVAPNLPAVVAAAAGPIVVIAQPPVQLLQLAAGATIETIVVETLPPPPRDAAPQTDTRPVDTVRSAPIQTEARQPAPVQTDKNQAEPSRGDARQVEPRAAQAPQSAQPATTARQIDTSQADSRQTVILRTSAGDIAIKTSVPLDDGARVALEVLRKAPDQVTARLVAINDVPVRQALAQTARERGASATS